MNLRTTRKNVTIVRFLGLTRNIVLLLVASLCLFLVAS